MEELTPGGEISVTETPEIARVGGVATLACKTEGSWLVYQTNVDGKWSDWKLNTTSFRHSEASRVQALRLGFRSREIAEVAATGKPSLVAVNPSRLHQEFRRCDSLSLSSGWKLVILRFR